MFKSNCLLPIVLACTLLNCGQITQWQIYIACMLPIIIRLDYYLVCVCDAVLVRCLLLDMLIAVSRQFAN